MTPYKQKPLERLSLGPQSAFGLDSVQGYLEMALWYERDGVAFHCRSEDRTKYNSMYWHLTQLEKEGHLAIEWVPWTSSYGEETVQLKQLALTTSGHKLLAELRAKSRWGKLKERLVTIAWAVASSVATTLAVLAVKGG